MGSIPGTPELVRSTCAQLGARGGELRSRGDGLSRAVAEVGGGWDGAAAVAFEAAAGVLADAFRSAGDELSQIAAAGRDYAARMAAAQREVAALAQRKERLTDEEMIVRAGTERLCLVSAEGLSPTAAAATAERLSVLRAESARVDQMSADVARRLEGDRDRFVTALEDSRPPTRLSLALGVTGKDAGIIAETAEGVKELFGDLKGAEGLLFSLRGADLARIRRYLWTGDLSALRRIDRKVLDAFERFRGPAWVKGKPLVDALRSGRLVGGEVGAARAVGGAVLGRVNLGMTIVDGFTDLVHGDPHHPGWRDTVTRVAGGVGAGGGAAMLVGGAALWPLGATAITAYGTYKIGTLIYDNRETIVNAAKAVWRRGSEFVSAGAQRAQEAWRAAKDAVAEKVGDAVDGVKNFAETAKDAVGERVGDAVEGVRDLADGAKDAIGDKLGALRSWGPKWAL